MHIKEQIHNLLHYKQNGFEKLDDNLQVAPYSFVGRIYSWIFEKSDEQVVNLALKFLADNKPSIPVSDATAILSRMRPLSKDPIAQGNADLLMSHFNSLSDQVVSTTKKIQSFHNALKEKNPSAIKNAYIAAAEAQLSLRKGYTAEDLSREFNEAPLIDIDGFEAYMMLRSDNEVDEIFLTEKPFCTLAMDQFKTLIDQWVSVDASPVRDQVKQNACSIIKKVLEDRKANPKMTDLIFEYLDKAIITDQNKNEFYSELYKHVTGGRIGDTCIESNSKLSDFNQFVALRFPDDDDQVLEISLAELRGMGGYFQIWVENRSKFTMDNTSILDEMTSEEFVILRKFLVNKDEVDLGDLPTRRRLHFLAERFCLSNITEACENAPFTTVDDAIAFTEEKQLKVLDLSAFGNEVTNNHLKKIGTLSGLTELRADSGGISNAGLAHLKELKKLRRLHVGGFWISNAGLAHLKDHEELREFTLKGTWVTGAGLAPLKELKKLRALTLSGPLLTDAGLEHIKELKELRELKFFDCVQLTNEGLADLKALKNLEWLQFFNCPQLTDTGIAHLDQLEKLRELDLLYCKQIEDADLDSFRRLRPDVSIRVTSFSKY
jgi:hypothetical protein